MTLTNVSLDLDEQNPLYIHSLRKYCLI